MRYHRLIPTCTNSDWMNICFLHISVHHAISCLKLQQPPSVLAIDTFRKKNKQNNRQTHNIRG